LNTFINLKKFYLFYPLFSANIMIKNVIAKPHFLDLVDIEDVHDVDFEEEEENDDDDAVPLTMMIICQFRSQSAARPMGSPGHTARAPALPGRSGAE
jgi:hypothetical protein